MTEQETLDCLRDACRSALKRDMRGYRQRMERAKTEIARGGDTPALRGEYVIASTLDCGCARDLCALRDRYREALTLLGGPSRLFPRGCSLFADYYNVFAICNVEAGHADENAARLAEVTALFRALTGGGGGADLCYRAQLACYRGDIGAALPLAREALRAAERDGQGLTALCAAETLAVLAKHTRDSSLWHAAAGVLHTAAENSGNAAVREQAGLLLCLQDLSFGFLQSVPDWVVKGDFGMIAAPWGYESVTDRMTCGAFPNALITRLTHASYSGDPVLALNIADMMRRVYGMRDVILDAYLGFFRAGCFLRLGDGARVREALSDAVAALAPDGLWLIAAEFAPAFGDALYEKLNEASPDGARRVREISANYWDKLASFRAEIVRGASLGLTKRERQIAALLLDGKTNAEIARRLGISERTVKGHATSIYGKYNISRRGQLAGAMRDTKETRLADWTK